MIGYTRLSKTIKYANLKLQWLKGVVGFRSAVKLVYSGPYLNKKNIFLKYKVLL